MFSQQHLILSPSGSQITTTSASTSLAFLIARSYEQSTSGFGDLVFEKSGSGAHWAKTGITLYLNDSNNF